jgi:hypothetical protein
MVGWPLGREASLEAVAAVDFPFRGKYTEVGKDGRFRAEGLTPGKTYNILIRRKGSIFGDFRLEAVTVEPGETKDLGDIVPRTRRFRQESD